MPFYEFVDSFRYFYSDLELLFFLSLFVVVVIASPHTLVLAFLSVNFVILHTKFIWDEELKQTTWAKIDEKEKYQRKCSWQKKIDYKMKEKLDFHPW